MTESESGKKYKCPYCKHIIESDKAPSLCPKCKKSMTIPDNLREKKFRDRRRDREKIINAAEKEKQRIFIPDHRFGRKPSSVFILMGILALAGAIVVYQSTHVTDRPSSEFHRIQRAEKELTAMRIALERFKRDVGRYPTEKEGLASLAFDPKVDGWGGTNRWRYINKIKPDQWRVEYQYTVTNGEVQVFSYGPDKIPGTDDDLYGSLPETNAPASTDTDTQGEDQTAEESIPVNIGQPAQK